MGTNGRILLLSLLLERRVGFQVATDSLHEAVCLSYRVKEVFCDHLHYSESLFSRGIR